MKPKKRKITPIILGLDQKTFETCSTYFQGRCRFLIRAIFLYNGTTASTIALGTYAVFGSPYLAVFIGLLLFLLLFTTDTFLNSARRHWTSVMIRILLLLVLPIINVCFFDLYIFDRDISLLHDQNNEIARTVLQKDATKVISRIEQNLDSTRQQKERLESEFDKNEKLKISELDGTGGSRRIGKGEVYITALGHIDTLQSRIKQRIDEANLFLKEGSSEIHKIKQDLSQQIDDLPNYQNTGLAYRLGLLLKKLSAKGNPMMQLFSLSYLLIVMIFDSILLLPVSYSPFKEYYNNIDQLINQQQALHKIKQMKMFETQSKKVKVALEQSLRQIELEANMEELKLQFKEINDRYLEELAMIEKLQKETAEVESKFDSSFAHMVNLASLRASDRIQDILDNYK